MKKLLMIIGAALSLVAMGDRVVNEAVTLAADADWAADGLVTIKPGASINLAGHNLTVADISQESNITNEILALSSATRISRSSRRHLR